MTPITTSLETRDAGETRDGGRIRLGAAFRMPAPIVPPLPPAVAAVAVTDANRILLEETLRLAAKS